MRPAVARCDDAPAGHGRTAVPGGEHAARAGDDRDQRNDVVRLELGLDDEIDVSGRQHAIGVAIAAIARQPHALLDAAERVAILFRHQQRARGEQHRLVQRGAGTHAELAVPGRAAIARRLAVSREALAQERLVHRAEHRFAESHQPDQRSPRRHAADEGFGAVDRIEHPDVFGIGMLAAVFLADDAVLGKRLVNERAHRGLGGAIRRRDRIEAADRALVVDAQRGAEERQDHFAGFRRQLLDEASEIDCRHGMFSWTLSH